MGVKRGYTPYFTKKQIVTGGKGECATPTTGMEWKGIIKTSAEAIIGKHYFQRREGSMAVCGTEMHLDT